MTIETFEESLSLGLPPAAFCEELQSLWYSRKGDWEKSHDLAQDIPSSLGSAIHAYLHRVEGDFANARYWYSRAGRQPFEGTLDEEWQSLLNEVLSI